MGLAIVRRLGRSGFVGRWGRWLSGQKQYGHDGPQCGDAEFAIPDCSDPRAIISYALHRLDVITTAYQAFLDTVRGRDDVSFALVVGLLAAEAHRRADAVAALARS